MEHRSDSPTQPDCGGFASSHDRNASPAGNNFWQTPGGQGSIIPAFLRLHQGIKKSVSDQLLLANGGAKIAGKFLIRTKTEIADPSNHIEFVLSVIYKGMPTNHTIYCDGDVPGGALVLNKMKTDFTDLAELIDHLKEKRKPLRWPVPLVEAVNAV